MKPTNRRRFLLAGMVAAAAATFGMRPRPAKAATVVALADIAPTVESYIERYAIDVAAVVGDWTSIAYHRDGGIQIRRIDPVDVYLHPSNPGKP